MIGERRGAASDFCAVETGRAAADPTTLWISSLSRLPSSAKACAHHLPYPRTYRASAAVRGAARRRWFSTCWLRTERRRSSCGDGCPENFREVPKCVPQYAPPDGVFEPGPALVAILMVFLRLTPSTTEADRRRPPPRTTAAVLSAYRSSWTPWKCWRALRHGLEHSARRSRLFVRIFADHGEHGRWGGRGRLVRQLSGKG